MTGNDYDVEIHGKPDGRVSRLGLGHAWEWTRANGSHVIFDCGLPISHVLDYMAVRLGIEHRAVTAKQAR